MALHKRIKIGGAHYRGYKLSVASASGSYNMVIVESKGFAANSFSVTPDQYGSGDTWRLEHRADADGTGPILAVLAESINNIGKGASFMLDFPAAELVNAGECLKFIYVNTASVAMNVYLVAEGVGLTKTS